MINLQESQQPQIMVIDHNQLFREKIVFLLTQNTKNQSLLVSHYADLASGLRSLQANSHINLIMVESALLENSDLRYQLKLILNSKPDLKIILLTAHHQPTIHAQVEQLSIDHILTKVIDPAELLSLITKILQPHNIAESSNYIKNLTPRELEILEWLVKGDSNKEIAKELHISESTVKVHVQNILKKFNVSSRVEAAVYAVRNELNAS